MTTASKRKNKKQFYKIMGQLDKFIDLLKEHCFREERHKKDDYSIYWITMNKFKDIYVEAFGTEKCTLTFRVYLWYSLSPLHLSWWLSDKVIMMIPLGNEKKHLTCRKDEVTILYSVDPNSLQS